MNYTFIDARIFISLRGKTMNNEQAFFQYREWAEDIYNDLKKKLISSFPVVNIRVQKTQITFSNTQVIGCVSFLKVVKKSETRSPYIVLTLGLPYALSSLRVKAMTEPYPGRWTVHIPIFDSKEIDKELLSWIKEAYLFAESK